MHLFNSLIRPGKILYSSFCRFTKNRFHRKFSGVTSNPTEVQIGVPWGYIAGRHWNEGSSKHPVICLHGWKDNSATFDRLMPLLIPSLNEHQFLCIDFPGHGHSSHYPPGGYYNFFDSFLWILQVMKHFSWKKVSIIGHSLGAVLGFLFTSTHPCSVKSLVTIDSLSPIIFSQADMLRMTPQIAEHLLAMEEQLKQQPPVTFTYDEALEKMLRSHMTGMHEVACKALMTRGLQEYPEGSGRFKFRHDIRVHYLPITTFSHRQISYLAKNFKSGLLHIKAMEGIHYASNYMRANIQHWIEESNDEPVKFVQIANAIHHLHLTDPNLIVDHIVDFLQKK